MDQIEYPKKEIWEERREWFEHELEATMTGNSYLVSDHATALFVDLQACFCCGAFLSVIILSISTIDAQLRETEALDDKIGTAKLLSLYFLGADIDWLRKLRNKYVHIDLNNPALTIDHQYTDRNRMEEDARKAIKMAIQAFFQSPGT